MCEQERYLATRTGTKLEDAAQSHPWSLLRKATAETSIMGDRSQGKHVQEAKAVRRMMVMSKVEPAPPQADAKAGQRYAVDAS